MSIVQTSFRWSYIDKLIRLLLGAALFLVMSHYLTPGEFGVMAITSMVITFANTVTEGGLNHSLIQKENLIEDDWSTVFSITMVVAILIVIFLYYFSSVILSFYEIEQYKTLFKVIILNIILIIYSSIFNTKAMKELRFEIIAKTTFISTIISTSLGIILFVNGYGLWSYVIYALLQNIIYILFIKLSLGWHPRIRFKLSVLKKHFSYGGVILFIKIFNIVLENIYFIIIVKVYGLSSLGLYHNAKKIQELLLNTLNMATGQVLFPVFSNNKHDDIYLKNNFKKVIEVLAFISFFLMGTILIVIDSIIYYVYEGAEWEGLVSIVRILSVSGLLHSVNSMNVHILKSKGLLRELFYLELYKKVIFFLAVIIGVNFDFNIFLCFVVVSFYVAFLMNSFSTSKAISYSVIEQIHDISVYFLMIMISVIVTYLVCDSIEIIHIKLIFQLLLISLIYFGMSYLYKVNALVNILSIISFNIKVSK